MTERIDTHEIIKNYTMLYTTNNRTHSDIVEKLIKIRYDIDKLKENYRENDLQSRLNLDHARGCEASLMWVLGR